MPLPLSLHTKHSWPWYKADVSQIWPRGEPRSVAGEPVIHPTCAPNTGPLFLSALHLSGIRGAYSPQKTFIVTPGVIALVPGRSCLGRIKSESVSKLEKNVLCSPLFGKWRCCLEDSPTQPTKVLQSTSLPHKQIRPTPTSPQLAMSPVIMQPTTTGLKIWKSVS